MKQANYISITGGEYRGRKILTPGGKTHPMGERERLALFNMLAGSVSGAIVLDVFAGSGALGIEALSRGASEVVFVDNSADAVQTIKNNLKNLGIESGARVIREKVSEVAKALNKFNIIIADPPYDDFAMSEVQNLAQILDKDGVLALSHPGDAPEIEGLILDKTRQYARAHISFYHK